MSCYLPDFPITFSEMQSVSLTAVEIGSIMTEAQLRHIIGNDASEIRMCLYRPVMNEKKELSI